MNRCIECHSAKLVFDYRAICDGVIVAVLHSGCCSIGIFCDTGVGSERFKGQWFNHVEELFKVDAQILWCPRELLFNKSIS